MDSLPVEIRVMIVRLLPHDGNDREALMAAYPRWKDAVDLEESLWVRSLTFDPAGLLGMDVSQILNLFDGPKLRRRQFLREIRLECYLCAAEQPDRCCILSRDCEGAELYNALDDLAVAIQDINGRASFRAGLQAPPLRLAFMTATNGLEKRKQCSARNPDHTRGKIKGELLCHFQIGSRMGGAPRIEGVEEWFFRNHGLFRYLDPCDLSFFIYKLPDLRVLRFEFSEELMWARITKDTWRADILWAIGFAKVVPVEELHAHVGCHSPRNEFHQPSHCDFTTDQATRLFQRLSSMQSLTVLRLSGQLRVPPSVFDDMIGEDDDPFPALTTFYLSIAPDTSQGDWFFVKDETEYAWAKAAADPEWANCVKLTKEGAFPQDPEPGSPVTGDDHYYQWEDESEPARRNRTLPNDATMSPLLRGAAAVVGKMEDIEVFSLCLSDNFAGDDCEHPFVPQFITRKFELHFVKDPEGKRNPTLTWKLGQKVDHWRPTEDVLEAWKAAAGEDNELEIMFVE